MAVDKDRSIVVPSGSEAVDIPTTGPVFYAVEVARRDDNVTMYLGRKVRNGRYERATLDEAARFARQEEADIHLDVFHESGPRVVALHSVFREKGVWDGWHETSEDGRRVLHGPLGETVRYEPDPGDRRGANYPWLGYTPEGESLLNPHDRPRRFASPLAARQALQKSMTFEYGSIRKFRRS